MRSTFSSNITFYLHIAYNRKDTRLLYSAPYNFTPKTYIFAS